MEGMGALMCELGNYSYSLDEMLSDEADFMAQLVGNSCNSNVACNEAASSNLWHETGFMYANFPSPADDHGITNYNIHHHHHDHDHVMMMMMSEEEECNKSMCHEDDHVESKKKRSRIHGDIPVPRNKRGGVKQSKRPKVDDERHMMMNSSSSFCSEDAATDSSCSTKTRPARGSATDPQSLYARKRRERINERLKVLQRLVPNGTKVDISTMLEEAVQYVKFLQLQIKLLSSDDMWMYAPIAYNGMDLGALHSKISPPPKPQS